jgi:hypothetical protein
MGFSKSKPLTCFADKAATIGGITLLGDGMRLGFPACRLEFRRNQFPACTRFHKHDARFGFNGIIGQGVGEATRK